MSLSLVRRPLCLAPPTLQWVVETGSPMLEATTTVRAEASSMLKPLGKKGREDTGVSVTHVWRGSGFRGGGGGDDGSAVWGPLPRWGDGGQVPAHGLDDPAAPHPQPGADAHAAVQQEPDGSGHVGGHAVGAVDEPQGDERADSVAAGEQENGV